VSNKQCPAAICFPRRKLQALVFRVISGLFEVGFSICLGKASDITGSTAVMGLTGLFVWVTLSMVVLCKATPTLALGTAYFMWLDIVAMGTVLMGIFYSQKPATF
jgi:quaternary ammonium compound-resistance protein SugE